MFSPAPWVVTEPLVLSSPVTATSSRVGRPGARATVGGQPTWQVVEARP
ncbi:hypothetical protein [Pyxidicoccus trucidator]|nr:hypothetical protein [Pyxidicoccus trucidator]